MKKAFRLLTALLFLGVAGTIFHFCASAHQRRQLAARLTATIEATAQSTPSRFAMTNATDFTWDRLVIAGPYTTHGEVEAALGRPWLCIPSPTYDLNAENGVSLLVFANSKGRVIRWCNISRFAVFATRFGNF